MIRWQAGLEYFNQSYDQDAVNAFSAFVLNPQVGFPVAMHSPQSAIDSSGIGLFARANGCDFGAEYWRQVVDFGALVRHGTIAARDLELLHYTDSVDDAYDWTVARLTEFALGQPGPML